MIGIIAAMEEEMSILREALESSEGFKKCGMTFYECELEGQTIILTVCGVGKVNAAMAATIMISEFNCELIINTGIAGGINNVQTRDVIIGSKLMYHDVDVTPFGYDYGQVPGLPKYFTPDLSSIVLIKKSLNELNIPYKEATIYSGDIFVNKLESLSNVDISGTVISEMEGAAIAHVCVKSGVDFVVLRFVSDVVGSENQINDYMAFEEEMARRSSTICLEILKRIA